MPGLRVNRSLSPPLLARKVLSPCVTHNLSPLLLARKVTSGPAGSTLHGRDRFRDMCRGETEMPALGPCKASLSERCTRGTATLACGNDIDRTYQDIGVPWSQKEWRFSLQSCDNKAATTGLFLAWIQFEWTPRLEEARADGIARTSEQLRSTEIIAGAPVNHIPRS